eukprot:16179-Heterococcus_DN1.PRE.2
MPLLVLCAIAAEQHWLSNAMLRACSAIRAVRPRRLPAHAATLSRVVTTGSTPAAAPLNIAPTAATGVVKAAPPAVSAAPRSFDTYEFVAELEAAGMSRDQAVAIMRQVKAAVAEATAARSELLATKQDLLQLNSELGEKVYSASMRFEMAQRHSKEINLKDLQNLRADLIAADQKDSANMQRDLQDLDKAIMRRRELDETRFASIQGEISAVERRILQYGVGTLFTMATLILAVVRCASDNAREVQSAVPASAVAYVQLSRPELENCVDTRPRQPCTASIIAPLRRFTEQ